MMDRISSLTNKAERLAIGLMSGTSVDGIDAVLAEVNGCGHDTEINLRAAKCFEWPDELRARIFAAFDGGVADLCALHGDLARQYAIACRELCRSAGVNLSEVDYVASHGQTVWHNPPNRKLGRKGTSLQLGDGSVLAAETGCLVVCDFRTADLALGGEGAPLVPLFDCYVLAVPGKRRVVSNIGGIANVTLASRNLDEVIAFDTGPGNALMDGLAQLIDPTLPFDPGGRIAFEGTPDEELLAEILSHPYFQFPPPKSTGRELFSKAMLEQLVERTGTEKLKDLMATLNLLTARSMAQGIQRFIGEVDELIVGGGGARNKVLMDNLKREMGGVPVLTLDDIGVDGDHKEALAFAMLGNETLHGRPGNVPRATGASMPAVLGKICLPPG